MSGKSEHTSTHDESVARRHEVSDVHFGRVLLTGFGLLGLMFLGLVYSWLVGDLASETTAEPGAPAEVLIQPGTENLPPLPRLQADPHVALAAMRQGEDSVLSGYAWVSRDSGLARIPVERAMELVLKEGTLRSREQ